MGKPAERQGRKAKGLSCYAWQPVAGIDVSSLKCQCSLYWTGGNIMKKVFKAVRLFVIAVTASAALLAGLYFYDTKAVANDDVIIRSAAETSEIITVAADTILKASAEVKADVVEESSTSVIETSVEESSEIITAEATVSETAAITEGTEATESAEKAAMTAIEAVTEKTETAAPAPETAATVPETAATVAETAAPAPSLTDIVYTDVNGNKISFASIDEAKASLNVAILPDPAGTAAANKAAYAAEASQVLELINQYRVANGLAALSYNDTLSTAAMERAAENAYADWNMTAMENGSKRHIRPDFRKASTIKDEYGLTGNWGENFGRYQEDAAGIVDGWKASSSHNALLLSADYSNIGIGVAQDSEGYYYWIALFN